MDKQTVIPKLEACMLAALESRRDNLASDTRFSRVEMVSESPEACQHVWRLDCYSRQETQPGWLRLSLQINLSILEGRALVQGFVQWHFPRVFRNPQRMLVESQTHPFRLTQEGILDDFMRELPDLFEAFDVAAERGSPMLD